MACRRNVDRGHSTYVHRWSLHADLEPFISLFTYTQRATEQAVQSKMIRYARSCIQGHWNWYHRKPLMWLTVSLHCNYVPLYCRFRAITTYWSKVSVFWLCVFGGRGRGHGVCVFGGLCVDMWRLVHQRSFLLFWLSFDCFWRFDDSYTVGTKMTIGVPIVTCLHRVRRIHKAVFFAVFTHLDLVWICYKEVPPGSD